MAIITEHSSLINIDIPLGDVHAKMEVFYNPVMVSNRNISILLLNTINKKGMKIADPLAGSGIRSLRFLQELKKGKIKELFVNDKKEDFLVVFEKSLRLNKLTKSTVNISNEDASLFLFHQGGFDYIDIDPFGSPNPFLAAAIARISRGGIVAVTATDTAALTGTYLRATKRKYWAASLRNYLMHEIGLRILIRKVQLQGVQFEKALIPILAYHKDHYFRVYFVSARSKEKCDEIMKQQQFLLYCFKCLNFKISHYNADKCACGNSFVFAGPLWAGSLAEEKLLKMMVKNNPFPEEQKFLELLHAESKINVIGFYDLHVIAKKYGLETTKLGLVLKKVRGVRTQFSGTGIKTEKSIKDVVKAMETKYFPKISENVK